MKKFLEPELIINKFNFESVMTISATPPEEDEENGIEMPDVTIPN